MRAVEGNGSIAGRRVLHVQKAKGIGGSERHIIDLSAGLRAAGARPEILWMEEAGFGLDRLCDLCRAHHIPTDRIRIRGHLDPTLPARLHRWIRRSHADVIHLHLIHATLHGAAAAGRSTLVATRHGPAPYQKSLGLRLAIRLADLRCRRVIVPSRWMRDHTGRVDGTPAEKLRIVRHGIDSARFVPTTEARATARRQLGIAEASLVVGSVARLHPSTDHATLLEAFAQLRAACPEAHLVLIGSGPLEGVLRQRVAALNLISAVHFLLERSDVPAMLAAFDVAAISSHREGFCLAALEAMAAGRPVVATRIGALPELVTDGREGLLVPAGDACAFARALIDLARDPVLRQRLGKAAALAARAYTIERMTRETAQIYREAVGAH